MDGEELATPSSSATPSHVGKITSKEKRKRTPEQKKEYNRNLRQNRVQRLKSAEKAVPVLSAGIRVAEEQNTALTATIQERELRADLLARRLEDEKRECAAAKEAQRAAEQAAREHQSALLLSVSCPERRVGCRLGSDFRIRQRGRSAPSRPHHRKRFCYIRRSALFAGSWCGQGLSEPGGRSDSRAASSRHAFLLALALVPR